MKVDERVVAALRVFLVILFAILVVFQTLSLPGQFRHMAEMHPEAAGMRWPLTIVAAFCLLCAQVIVGATWKLLALVTLDQLFSESSTVWVNAIVRAIGAALVVLVAVFAYVVVHAHDPGLPMLLLLVTVGVAVVGLLMIVMRALLRQATTLRTDMDAVI